VRDTVELDVISLQYTQPSDNLQVPMKKNANCLVFATSVTLSAMFTGGCAASTEDGAASRSETSEALTRTIVTFDVDGTEKVRTETITRETQLREIEERETFLGERAEPKPKDGVGTTSSALTLDSGCAGSSLWMFDGQNLSGNEICFTGAGWANLANYSDRMYCSGNICSWGTWAKNVRSLWAGVDPGALAWCRGFSAWERRDVLSPDEQNSSSLSLDLNWCAN
jgi:hypothetical protein